MISVDVDTCGGGEEFVDFSIAVEQKQTEGRRMRRHRLVVAALVAHLAVKTLLLLLLIQIQILMLLKINCFNQRE